MEMSEVSVQDIYYGARRLRWWLETEITADLDHSVPIYLWIMVRDVVESPGATVQEISRRLGMAQSMVSKAVAEAEHRGWIRREKDDQDRRRVRIHPMRRKTPPFRAGI